MGNLVRTQIRYRPGVWMCERIAGPTGARLTAWSIATSARKVDPWTIHRRAGVSSPRRDLDGYGQGSDAETHPKQNGNHRLLPVCPESLRRETHSAPRVLAGRAEILFFFLSCLPYPPCTFFFVLVFLLFSFGSPPLVIEEGAGSLGALRCRRVAFWGG